MGRTSTETLDGAHLSGCIYVQRRAVRKDAARLREDAAELKRLEQLAKTEEAA